MRFSLQVSAQFPFDVNVGEHFSQVVEQARLARDVGFDGAFLLQHYMGNMQALQPQIVLSRLSGEVPGFLLGTNILILPLHHPVEIAEQFATLDVISGGKAVLGVGLGYRENEFATFGIDRAHRVGRLTEAIEVIRRFWTGEAVTFHGRHFTVEDQRIGVIPAQAGGPPIWIGAGGEKAIRRAARIADAWLIAPDAKLKRVTWSLAAFREELEANGKSLIREYPLNRDVFLANDGDLARQEAREYIWPEYKAYADLGVPWIEQKFDELCRDAFIIGSADDCMRAFGQFEALGITRMILRLHWCGMNMDKVKRTLDVLGDKVIPAFTRS